MNTTAKCGTILLCHISPFRISHLPNFPLPGPSTRHLPLPRENTHPLHISICQAPSQPTDVCIQHRQTKPRPDITCHVAGLHINTNMTRSKNKIINPVMRDLSYSDALLKILSLHLSASMSNLKSTNLKMKVNGAFKPRDRLAAHDLHRARGESRQPR